MATKTADCRKFTPNIFNKSKCSHCFRQREEHTASALECNRASRKVSKCGYLFVAPDWDFSNPLYRTKRWQRRWFVLYDDGEFTYSVDDHPETIPQACIDMTKVLEVTTAEEITGHTHSLAITASDRVTFVKGTCPEEAKWWLNILSAFPKIKGRHKRNATFPGGQSTIIHSQSGRNRHNSFHKNGMTLATGQSLDIMSASWCSSTSTSSLINHSNFNHHNELLSPPLSPTISLITHQTTAATITTAAVPTTTPASATTTTVMPSSLILHQQQQQPQSQQSQQLLPVNLNNTTNNIENNNKNTKVYSDQPISSKSPPTRDKLHPDSKAQVRIRNRTRVGQDVNGSASLLVEDALRDEKLKDIANTITTLSNNNINSNNNNNTNINNNNNTHLHSQNNNNNRWSSAIIEKPTRDENSFPDYATVKMQIRPKSLQLTCESTTTSSTAPSIVSAITKKQPQHSTSTVSSSPSPTQLSTTIVGKINENQSRKISSPINNTNLLINTTNNNQNNYNQNVNNNNNNNIVENNKTNERGDPDGGCNLDDLSTNYYSTKSSELRVNLPAEELLNSKKGWLMKQESRSGDWTKHWFTLKGAALFYYRDPITEERGVLDGVLDVNGLTSVSEIPVARHYGFQLITWDNRRIILSTINSNTRNNWINVLRSAAGLVVVQQPQQQRSSNITKGGTSSSSSSSTSSSTSSSPLVENEKIDNELIIKNIKPQNNQEKSIEIGTNIEINVDKRQEQSLVTSTNKTLPPLITSVTPKSIIFSSDEEYRTASEGGRRDSVDWGSPLSPSIPNHPTMISQIITKDRIRPIKSNTSLKLQKRSRSSPPSSRRSTLESVISDDLPKIQSVQEELNIDKELLQRLTLAEKELIQLREEVRDRDLKQIDLINSLERTEFDLNQQILMAKDSRDNLANQLNESRKKAEEIILRLTNELDDTNLRYKDLEDRLNRGIDENDILYKKIRDLENGGGGGSGGVGVGNGSVSVGSVAGTTTFTSLSNLNRSKMKRMDSLSDLTTFSDIDPYCLDRDVLAEEYSELKSRFEKAINEIRAMKKELKESQCQYDNLEIINTTMRQELDRKELDVRSQVDMMGARIQDLTFKYSNSDRQVRMLKQKLCKSEKRRSLSLKGRESLVIQKELEDKVTELENKLDTLEIDGPTATATTTTTTTANTVNPCKPLSLPLDERTLKRTSARLRRKSLDLDSLSQVVSANETDTMQVLLRVNTLEKRIENACSVLNDSLSSSSSSKFPSIIKECGSAGGGGNGTKMSEHLIDRLRSLEMVVIKSKDRIEQGLQQLQCLKSSKSRRSVSPITDRKDTYRLVEKNFLEAIKILRDSCENCITTPTGTTTTTTTDDLSITNKMIHLSDTNPIKLALTQLESQLRNKLNDLLKQRRMLRENNDLSSMKNLELLAERIAFESICFGKLRDAIKRAENPIEFGEIQTRAEAVETSKMMSLLKAKLSGNCAIKPSGTLDILASVLARRLVLSAHRIGEFKISQMSPISLDIMDDLLRQQNELHLITKRYKTNTMETLACGLAAETLSYISANDAVQGVIQEAWRTAQETVNIELVQSEICQIMMKNCSRFENSITPSFGYTLTGQERVSFENFADAVQDELRKEMEITIQQLTKCYEESLLKMKRGHWHMHLEQEQIKASEGRQLLAEFADIIAHKALVDARITILKGEYTSKDLRMAKDAQFSLVELQKYENLFAELATDLQISKPDDILAEADFNFMFNHFNQQYSITKLDIHEIVNVLEKLEHTIVLLQSTLNPNTNITTSKFDANTLDDICNKCLDLQLRVEPLIPSAQLLQAPCDDCNKLRNTLDYLTEKHDTDLNELKKQQNDNYLLLQQQLDQQLQLTRQLENEKLKIMNELSVERDLVLQHQDELNEITKKLEKQINECHLKDDENFELIENLEDERQRIIDLTDDTQNIYQQLKEKSNVYNALVEERDFIKEQLENERDHVRKLEKRLELLQEEQSQQIESLHATYKDQKMCAADRACRDNDGEDDETSFKLRYQTEIEQLRTLCEKGLVAMESSHRRIIQELEEKHRHEIQRLLNEKEQALAEETQATLAALDAMRKAHQSEVQREVTRFKAEFVRQFQKGGHSTEVYKGKEEELDEVREEILSLSEKYSTKCVEAATLEEKCRSATQQLKHFQQHIQQLENRNKQLRAHIVSEDSDFRHSLSQNHSYKETTSGQQQQKEEFNKNIMSMMNVNKNTSFINNDNNNYIKDNNINCSPNNRIEIHPRLNLNEGIKLASIYAQPKLSSHNSMIHEPNVNLINIDGDNNNDQRLLSLDNQIITLSSSSSPPPTQTTTPTTTKIYSPKITTMKLRLNQHRNLITKPNDSSSTAAKLTTPPSINCEDNQHNCFHHHSSNNNNNNNNNNNLLQQQPQQNKNIVLQMCSPPLPDEKDVEHIRRFELEI